MKNLESDLPVGSTFNVVKSCVYPAPPRELSGSVCIDTSFDASAGKPNEALNRRVIEAADVRCAFTLSSQPQTG